MTRHVTNPHAAEASPRARLPAKAAQDEALGALHCGRLLRAGLVVKAQQVQQAVHQQDAALVVQRVPAGAARCCRPAGQARMEVGHASGHHWCMWQATDRPFAAWHCAVTTQ
jgi:hypothetical protein